MKRFCLTLTSLLVLSPAAMAQQFGMDQSYNEHMYQQMQGPAFNSTADAKTFAYQTQESAWSDMDYVSNQYSRHPGQVLAPIQNSPFGAVSTFKQNQGQWLRGGMINGAQLPTTRTGLNAINGGFDGNACGLHGSGGFRGSGGGSKLYPNLPPTSTSTVQLDTAF